MKKLFRKTARALTGEKDSISLELFLPQEGKAFKYFPLNSYTTVSDICNLVCVELYLEQFTHFFALKHVFTRRLPMLCSEVGTKAKQNPKWFSCSDCRISILCKACRTQCHATHQCKQIIPKQNQTMKCFCGSGSALRVETKRGNACEILSHPIQEEYLANELVLSQLKFEPNNAMFVFCFGPGVMASAVRVTVQRRALERRQRSQIDENNVKTTANSHENTQNGVDEPLPPLPSSLIDNPDRLIQNSTVSHRLSRHSSKTRAETAPESLSPRRNVTSLVELLWPILESCRAHRETKLKHVTASEAAAAWLDLIRCLRFWHASSDHSRSLRVRAVTTGTVSITEKIISHQSNRHTLLPDVNENTDVSLRNDDVSEWSVTFDDFEYPETDITISEAGDMDIVVSKRSIASSHLRVEDDTDQSSNSDNTQVSQEYAATLEALDALIIPNDLVLPNLTKEPPQTKQNLSVRLSNRPVIANKNEYQKWSGLNQSSNLINEIDEIAEGNTTQTTTLSSSSSSNVVKPSDAKAKWSATRKPSDKLTASMRKRRLMAQDPHAGSLLRDVLAIITDDDTPCTSPTPPKKTPSHDHNDANVSTPMQTKKVDLNEKQQETTSLIDNSKAMPVRLTGFFEENHKPPKVPRVSQRLIQHLDNESQRFDTMNEKSEAELEQLQKLAKHETIKRMEDPILLASGYHLARPVGLDDSLFDTYQGDGVGMPISQYGELKSDEIILAGEYGRLKTDAEIKGATDDIDPYLLYSKEELIQMSGKQNNNDEISTRQPFKTNLKASDVGMNTLPTAMRSVLTCQIRIDRSTNHIWAALPANVDMVQSGFSAKHKPPKLVFIPRELSLGSKHGDWVAVLLSSANDDGERIGKVVAILANARGQRVEIVPLIHSGAERGDIVAQFDEAMQKLIDTVLSVVVEH